MEDFVYYNFLLDIYGDFLTENNKTIFNYYYGENLSMQEIADLMGVSKSFVGSSIKKSEKKLNDLESKLHLNEKNKKLRKLLKENDLDKIKKEIEKIID